TREQELIQELEQELETTQIQEDETQEQENSQKQEQVLKEVLEQEFAVAWDLDGVVFHAVSKMNYIKTIFHVSARLYGSAYRQLRDHGKGSINTWRLLCLQKGDLNGAKYFQRMILSKKLYADTPNIIQRLHKRGYKLFLASNVSKDEIALHK